MLPISETLLVYDIHQQHSTLRRCPTFLRYFLELIVDFLTMDENDRPALTNTLLANTITEHLPKSATFSLRRQNHEQTTTHSHDQTNTAMVRSVYRYLLRHDAYISCPAWSHTIRRGCHQKSRLRPPEIASCSNVSPFSIISGLSYVLLSRSSRRWCAYTHTGTTRE